MQYEFRIQDPTDPPRNSLIDTLTDILSRPDAIECRGIFAFVTGRGLGALLADEGVKSFFERGTVELIIGLDAVTDRAALMRIQELQNKNENFNARVVVNTSGAIIHPKFIHVIYSSGDGVIIVGSGNLTLGGLSGNVEAYSVLRYERDNIPDFREWDGFIGRWGALLRPIDEEAFNKAERNERKIECIARAAGSGSGPEGEEVLSAVTEQPDPEKIKEDVAGAQELMLVAQIPRAGSRWSQAHFNLEMGIRYFGVDPRVSAGITIFLREVNSNDFEERRVVFSSTSNRNVKIEIGAARRAARQFGYPVTSRPIVVFRKEGARQRHRYVLLMPGDAGYMEMLGLTTNEYTGPNNQVPRVVIPRTKVIHAWPGCPL